MTLWALVSDIHGNRPALEAAERIARGAGAERFVSLGDVIGLGDPNGCVRWVQEVACLAVVGNRDLGSLGRIVPELRRVVLAWPREAMGPDFIISHGDRRLHRVLNAEAEQDGFGRALGYLEERAVRVWFFGHTHRSRCWELCGGRARPLDPLRVEMRTGCRYAVNVGTVGLPLWGRGGPSFTLYDDRAGVIQSVPLALSRRRERAEHHAIISEAMQGTG